MSEPIVEISTGKLKGTIRKTENGVDIFSFKGIPYAKAPVGELRFLVPKPPEPWKGIRDATEDASQCPQYQIHFDTYIGNEDCLYLNVYTPELPASETFMPLPVMVYIHGGGFLFGQGANEKDLGPDYLIEKNVVLVTINYRLGILGFLSLGCKEAPGNMGLWDQVEALKWVKSNIKSFNGDPNNVTVFGVSAGGASVEYLILSKAARGLFHKAIIHCGSSLCHWGQYNKIKQLAYKTAALGGNTITNDKELLRYLKSLEVRELTVLSMKALATDSFRGGIHFGFVPTVEEPDDWEPFMDGNTYEMLSKGDLADVPIITGFSKDEGLLIYSIGVHIFNKVLKDRNLIEALPFELTVEQEQEVKSRLEEIYFKSESGAENLESSIIDYFTDTFVLGAVYTAMNFMAKNNKNPVYLYEFNYDGGLNVVKKMLNITRKGVCHGDELGYLMKTESINQDPSESDLKVLEYMTTMWTNMAKYGNPTPDDKISIKWEPVSADKKICLQISDKLSLKDEVYPERINVLMELYEKYTQSNLSKN